MIGVVIVTHGNLATEFFNALQHVVGPQTNMKPICIGADDNMELCREQISTAIKEVDSGDGTIVLTDMFGGTPSNLSISFLRPEKVEVLAGINLPMLVSLASKRKTATLEEVATHAQQAGRKYIHVASKILQGAD